MGLFWLGASLGYFGKMIVNKWMRQRVYYGKSQTEPWQFPIYMTTTGLLFVYYDWYRRLSLEASLTLEERKEGSQLAYSRMIEDPIISDRRTQQLFI